MADQAWQQLQDRCIPMNVHALVAYTAALGMGDVAASDYWAGYLRGHVLSDDERQEARAVIDGVVALARERGVDFAAMLRDTAAMGGQMAAASQCAVENAARNAGRPGPNYDD